MLTKEEEDENFQYVGQSAVESINYETLSPRMTNAFPELYTVRDPLFTRTGHDGQFYRPYAPS